MQQGGGWGGGGGPFSSASSSSSSSSSGSANFKRPLKVIFDGEDGIDAGGPRREFFSMTTRTMFNPEFGMFTEETSEVTRALWFRAGSLEPPIYFELIGSLLGLAIYNRVLLDVHFPIVLYRKLLGGAGARLYTLRDLEDFKPDLARQLSFLLSYEGEDLEDVFSLDFTVSREEFGEVKTLELVPGGGSIAVTAANRKQYVHAYLQWLLHTSIAPQFDAFSKGFNAVMAGDALDMLSPSDLASLVRGSEALDMHALQAATKYEGPYTASHPTIKLFWSIVHSFSEEEKKKFLAFVSGSDRAPLKGLGDLPLVVQRAGPETDRLPTASTCFFTLLLPQYKTKEKMTTKLKAAIAESEGFGLI